MCASFKKGGPQRLRACRPSALLGRVEAFPFSPSIRAHVFQTFLLAVRLCQIAFVVSRNVLLVFVAPRCSALSGAFHALAAICPSGRNMPVGARFAGEVQASPIRLRGFAGHLAHGWWLLFRAKRPVLSGDALSVPSWRPLHYGEGAVLLPQLAAVADYGVFCVGSSENTRS
jgi:hypothetical protein